VSRLWQLRHAPTVRARRRATARLPLCTVWAVARATGQGSYSLWPGPFLHHRAQHFPMGAAQVPAAALEDGTFAARLSPGRGPARAGVAFPALTTLFLANDAATARRPGLPSQRALHLRSKPLGH